MNFIEKAFVKSFRLKPKMTGSQWADSKRYVAPGTSPEPGEWRTDRVPYLREPMDSATDKITPITVMCCASQIAKSELLLNVMGYFIDQDPSSILMVQPTVEAAESFSKERIDPTIRYSVGLQDKFELDGKEGRSSSRKSSMTIRQKQFPGGFLALVGSNSPAGLASRPIRVLLCDEVDRFEKTREGDPLELAMQRTANFHNRKIILVSTPTIKGESAIYDWYEKSDQRKYYVPCPHCGHEYIWAWSQVKWDKDENGEALPETAKMFCPECGAQVRGAYKPDMSIIAAGRWKATENSRIRGYHLSALYSPWVNLYEMVEQFVRATKNRDKDGLMEFVNLKLGEAWEDVAAGEDDWEILHRRREWYKTESLPEGVLLLTCGVDVQHDRLEATLYGWGLDKEAWIIEHRKMYGEPDDPATWRKLDEFLLMPRYHPNGTHIPVSGTCVDSGDGSYTQNVYEYTKPREGRNVYSIKGRGGVGVPFISSPTQSNRIKARLFTIGVDSGKDLIMSALKVEDEGPSFIHVPRDKERGCDEEFCRQLYSEYKERKFEKGKLSISWKKYRERNEALDCAVYARAAYEILNPNMPYLASLINKSSGQAKHTPPATMRGRRTLSKGISL